MPLDIGGLIGAVLAGFFVVLISHKGDVKKVIDRDIERRVSKEGATDPVFDTGGANAVLLQAQQTNVDMLFEMFKGTRREVNGIRRDLDALRRDFETYRKQKE